eukprot:166832-Pyramimonas_sp.AAC.1
MKYDNMAKRITLSRFEWSSRGCAHCNGKRRSRPCAGLLVALCQGQMSAERPQHCNQLEGS